VSKIVAPLAALFAILFVHSSGVSAQQPDRPPNLKLGDAVVTGFSGTLAPDPAKPRPRGKSVIDLTFINPDGPSARIVAVGQPGFVWDGRLFTAPKAFDVLAKDVGQVFGIALDDQTPPNIYLTATSAFGLQLVGHGRDGRPERRKKGGPGVVWMKGQFGLELQGGPGSIYKVDGRTGVVSLFANVALDGIPNPAPGLGSIAYDAAHKQLFASDLYTGMIHRFALDGRDLGTPYDHGVTGRPTRANLAPHPFNPRNRPNIASARFDSENPNTWGFAPPARRVWALAVHEGRLYYSARNGAPINGPQIWSIGIRQDGNFAADPRWELDVSGEPGPYPVSDIAFSNKGAMILAQRAPIAASYDYSAFTKPGEPRVLRYWLKDRNDPPSPGRWKLVPEEYAVGFAGNYRNTNGGVALGYGYDRAGVMNDGACEAALWTTGQNLRNNPALKSQLEPGGPLVVHGLQGSPADQVRNANTPPAISYFIDYDDQFNDPRASGHTGIVRILVRPCAAPAAARPIAPPVNVAIIGTPRPPQACKPTCVCPPGTVLVGKECVKRECPPPQVFNPAINACACPPGTVLVGKECVKRECPPPQVLDPATNSCKCPPGTVLVGKECVHIQKQEISCRPPLVYDPATGTCVPRRRECPPPLVLSPTDTCICPQGTVMQDDKCVPQICPPPLVPGPCECPEGTVQDGKLCVPKIDLAIGKEIQYGVGSATWFNLWVSNAGPPITFQAGQLTVTDTIPAGMTVTSVSAINWTCGPPPPPNLVGPATLTCTYNLAGTLATGADIPNSIIVYTTITDHDHPITNCAHISVDAAVGVDGNPANDTACVTVPPSDNKIDVGINKTGGTTPYCPAPYYSFTIVVTNVGAGWPATGNVVVHDTVPAGMTFTVPPPCVPSGVLSAGTPFTCTYSGPAPTTTQPLTTINIQATATGSAPFPPFTNCASVTIPSSSGYVDSNPANNNSCVTVTKPSSCTCPPPQVMNADGICTCPPPMVSIPGAICGCPPPMVPGATPNTCVCPQGTTLENGTCVPVNTCPPPMVPGPVAGQCICPPGTVLHGKECVPPLVCDRPLIPNAAGTECVCPRGLVLRRGKCIEPIECRPPQIPNAAGTACVCRSGLVKRGRRCVRPIVCREPARLNRAGTACICPRGMTLRGNRCVERERRQRFNRGEFPGFPGPRPRHDGPRGGRDQPFGPRGR
jgi:Domain of unknown function DUF11